MKEKYFYELNFNGKNYYGCDDNKNFILVNEKNLSKIEFCRCVKDSIKKVVKKIFDKRKKLKYYECFIKHYKEEIIKNLEEHGFEKIISEKDKIIDFDNEEFIFFCFDLHDDEDMKKYNLLDKKNDVLI